AVRRSDEGHVAIAGRAVYGDAVVHQLLAKRMDVVHFIGKVTEVAAARIIFGIPVVGQFDTWRLAGASGIDITRGGEEDQREPALLVFGTTDLLQPEKVRIEAHRGVEIPDPDHGVKVAHE